MLRFPRSRGGSPEVIWLPGMQIVVPPLARGFPLGLRGPYDADAGSPARAGIDRFPGRPEATASRFPRSRGDRPSASCQSGI